MKTGRGRYWGDESQPMVEVSWDGAVKFCQWLSRKEGRTYRLPTEAQWEYACRAGTTTRFSFGDDEDDLYRYGNYCDRSNTNGYSWQDKAHDDGHDKTAPVGSYRPSRWGLYDMHGNVWEWCADWYGEQYPRGPVTDPTGPPDGKRRVVRGGSWMHAPWACRSAIRSRIIPNLTDGVGGFRVLLDLSE